jgi:protein-L-isoaspartate(D-aspartate) O-methyltransferase
MIAQMLELLDARSGARILEIGTGSGYNAALLATIAGPRGVVVTVELEADLAQRARTILDELGFHNVDVRTGNGETLPIDGMFDRIIVTAREDDIPLVWWDALGEGGRIVIPLDLPYGGERVVAFVRTGNRLLSIATQPCLFIGMREREGERSGDIFFRNASLRYNATPSAQAPLAIVGMRRADVQPDMLEEADVVVARPETFFAITHLTRA